MISLNPTGKVGQYLPYKRVLSRAGKIAVTLAIRLLDRNAHPYRFAFSLEGTD